MTDFIFIYSYIFFKSILNFNIQGFWWFLDQKDGMEKQLDVLSNFGLLSRFVGMVTDSRSFLSLPRHEYFRRILCNVLGEEIQKGELPNNMKLIGTMVEAICYKNAEAYFDINKK